MAKFIEARVIQKVDTEANWMANPLKLYQGEVAFVSDKYNFKLNTTKTPKTFAQLEYYYKGDILGGVLPTDNLASKPDGVYRATISGTYSGVVAKEGYYTLLRKEGGVWKLESEVKMPMQDLTDLENRTTALENRIEPNGNVTVGQTARAVNGDKVERYVQRNAFVDFKHSFADKDGYEINSKVFVDNKFWISKVDGNKDYPSKSSTKWKEFKITEDLENSVNTLNGKVQDLEEDINTLDGKIQVVEDDINTLESELNITQGKVSDLENKNGGEVDFGNTKNVTGSKVFDYVNNKSITKFNPTAYNGGYPKDALVFHNDNVWMSMVNLNTETPQKGTSRWKEVKFNSDSKITIKDVSQQLPKDYDGDMVPVWNESLKNWSTAFQVRENPLASTIPVRSGDGNLKTDKALQDEDAVSKVNENIVIFNTISEARDYLTKTKYVDFGKVVFVKSEGTYYKVNRDKNDLVTLIDNNGILVSFFDLNDTPDNSYDSIGKVLKVGDNGKIIFDNITKDDFDSNTEEGLNVFLWNTETQVWESALATKNNTSYSVAMRGENGTLQVGNAVNDREAVNLGQLKDYANPNALIKPEVDGNLDDFPYVVGVNREGDTAFLPVNSFGKVDTVMGIEPDANKNVDISGIETNWTNENHRWSNLPNKSADATYDKVMVLNSNGKAGVKNLDFVPYTGANKPIDLNTQKLRIGGDFNKSFSTFERSHLAPNETGVTHFTRLTDVASFSRGNDIVTKSDCIVITLPIKAYTRWVMEVDILSPYITNMFKGTSEKLIIGATTTSNTHRSVTAVSGADSVKSVSFGRDENNNTVIIIRPFDDNTNFSYGRVNIANFYHSALYHADLAVKSNYQVEAVLESSLTGLTTNGTITNAQFTRDSYYLDFRNFTNVPNFAQASNVFAKDEATNWTNASQRFSGLVDKSTDATYNKVMVLDADGKAGTKDAGDFGKVKTVNGQEPDENGNIPLDCIPLTGTKEGKPLGGSFKIDDESEYIIYKGSDNVESSEPSTILSMGSELRMDAVRVEGETYTSTTYSISPTSLESYLTEESDTFTMSYAKVVNSSHIMESLDTSEGDSLEKSYHTNIANYTRLLLSDGNKTRLTQTNTAFSIEFNNQPFIAIEPADIVTKAYLNPATLINILTSASAEQINQIKTLLGI